MMASLVSEDSDQMYMVGPMTDLPLLVSGNVRYCHLISPSTVMMLYLPGYYVFLFHIWVKLPFATERLPMQQCGGDMLETRQVFIDGFFVVSGHPRCHNTCDWIGKVVGSRLSLLCAAL